MIALLTPHRRLEPRTEPSPRQREVWQHICAGLTNDGIAHAMGVSRKTVIRTREDLYKRLGAHCIAEVVLAGVRAGVVTVERDAL